MARLLCPGAKIFSLRYGFALYEHNAFIFLLKPKALKPVCRGFVLAIKILSEGFLNNYLPIGEVHLFCSMGKSGGQNVCT
jgi:hypothetical protein